MYETLPSELGYPSHPRTDQEEYGERSGDQKSVAGVGGKDGGQEEVGMCWG